MPSNDPLLTRKEAAQYLNVEATTLAAWAVRKTYDLPYVRIGRVVRYRKSDLDRFIAENTVDAGPPK